MLVFAPVKYATRSASRSRVVAVLKAMLAMAALGMLVLAIRLATGNWRKSSLVRLVTPFHTFSNAKDDAYDPSARILPTRTASFFQAYAGARKSSPSSPRNSSPQAPAASPAGAISFHPPPMVTVSNDACSEFPSRILPDDAVVGEDCRYFRVTGFNFCSGLDGASFDGLAFVEAWNATVASKGITAGQFVLMIDEIAKRIDMIFMERYNGVLDIELGILLLAHGEPSVVENILALVNEIDDGTCLILIHVDLNSESLHETLSTRLAHRFKNLEANVTSTPDAPFVGNVHMAKRRFRGEWATPALVWMELNGFFELADMADIDHFINLSAVHWPLRKPVDIARALAAPQFMDKSFIDYRRDYEESAARSSRAYIRGNPSYEKKMAYIREAGLVFPPFPSVKACKHHQWIILSRRALEYLRTDRRVATHLAYSEFVEILDESFFCRVLYSSAEESPFVINEPKIAVHFPHKFAKHPIFLTLENKEFLGNPKEDVNPEYFFARKIDVTDAKGKELIAWIREEHMNRANHRTPRPEKEGIEPLDELTAASNVTEADGKQNATDTKDNDDKAPTNALSLNPEHPVAGDGKDDKQKPPADPAPKADENAGGDEHDDDGEDDGDN
ncbi:hypothetical protein HDU96_003847 [Phlyctochytrium bullatum]|nr:hypothetical protein HDU96_003847 [Phlyctochytrium bullatum]